MKRYRSTWISAALAAAAVVLAIPLSVEAAVIANYTFATDLTSSDSESNSTAGSLSAGSGLPNGGISSQRYRVRSDDTDSTASGAVSGNDYISFTVTPGSGYQFSSFTSLTLDYGSESNGNKNYYCFLRSSVDNYAANIGSTLNRLNDAGMSNSSIGLLGLAAQSSNVTFRLYFYDDTDHTARLHVLDNLVLNGSVSGAPAPTLSITTPGSNNVRKLVNTTVNIVGSVGNAAGTASYVNPQLSQNGGDLTVQNFSSPGTVGAGGSNSYTADVLTGSARGTKNYNLKVSDGTNQATATRSFDVVGVRSFTTVAEAQFGSVLVDTAVASGPGTALTSSTTADNYYTNPTLAASSWSSGGVTVSNASAVTFDSMSGKTASLNTSAAGWGTSGHKSGTVPLTITPEMGESYSISVTYGASVYQRADVTVTGGSDLRITNAAADGVDALRADARLLSLTRTAGDAVMTIIGMDAGGAGVGTVIHPGVTAIGTGHVSGNPLNGTYTATWQAVLEHSDQMMAGAHGSDVGSFVRDVTVEITGKNGNQSVSLAGGRRLKGLSGTSDQSLGTVAQILDGYTGGDRVVSMSWRSRTTAESTQANGQPGMPAWATGLLSDVASVAIRDGGNPVSDTVVLQMPYLESLIYFDGAPPPNPEAFLISKQRLFLAWLDTADNTWKNAVAGNVGKTGQYAQANVATPYETFWAGVLAAHPTATLADVLGSWGVDSSPVGGGNVWAVIDHNSEFAALPEPATLTLCLAGGVLALLRRRR